MNGNDLANAAARALGGLLIAALATGVVIGGAVVTAWNYFGG